MSVWGYFLDSSGYLGLRNLQIYECCAVTNLGVNIFYSILPSITKSGERMNAEG